MRRVLLGLGVAVLLAGTSAWGGDATKKDREKLQGTWAVKSIVAAGKEIPTKGEKMVIAGDKMTMKGGPKGDEYGTYTINAGKTPKQITMTEKKDGKDGDVMQGIYTLEGDTLKLAFSTKGPGGARPTSFNDKEAAVITLKREKS